MAQKLNSLEKKIIATAAKTIDLGSCLKCIPYRRLARDSATHSPLEIKLYSWWLFVTISFLSFAHLIMQWAAFLSNATEHGMDVRACLHVNFLALYSFSSVFRLELILHPEGILAVQNEIHGMQKHFETSWTHHPVIIILVPLFQVFHPILPLVSVAFYILDPTYPMFVITSVLFGDWEDELQWPSIAKTAVGATIEAFLFFYSALTICPTSQACAIIDETVNIWTCDVR